MPIAKTILLFQYRELSDSAKERARQWYADCLDSSDYEHVIADAEHVGALFGLTLARDDYKTMGGATRSKPAVYWSGFSSQGDGASFDGSYRYKRGALSAVRAECPQDKTLHAIVLRLQNAQKTAFYKLRAECKHSGQYMHSGCMDVAVTNGGDEYAYLSDSVACEMREALRRFADWIYANLEQQDTYLRGQDNLEERIISNEYTFTEDGTRTD